MQHRSAQAFLLIILLVLSPLAYALPTKISSDDAYQQKKVELDVSATAVTTTKVAWQDAPAGNRTEKLKEHWKAIVHLAQARLELQRTWIELNPRIDSDTKAAILADIDALDARLEALIPRIDDMTTILDALTIIRDYLDIWKDYIWKAKKYYGTVVLTNLDKLTDKGNEIGDMMNDKITFLEGQGQDVTELERIYTSYMQHVKTVEDKSAEAWVKINAMNGWEGHQILFLEAATLYVEAQSEGRLAMQDLRAFVNELKDMGVIVGVGTGTVYAVGSGSAEISGDGMVTLQSLDDADGTMQVWDYVGEAVININAAGSTENGDGSTTYTGVTSGTVTGSDIRVIVRGNGYSLKAAGSGQVTLVGTGYYHFGNADQKIDFDTQTAIKVTVMSNE